MAAKKFKQTYVVQMSEGARFQSFPLDMLRYDSSHPATESDANRMEDPRSDNKIVLERFIESKEMQPAEDRWRSFRWSVIEVKTVKL